MEGERKQVTVMFADVKGSMEFVVGRDPEDAQSLLDPLIERMIEAVHLYEGTVNDIMGDGIMALFGAPIAHEDHAVRACYAALRMQANVKRYADQIQRTQGVLLTVRVGLIQARSSFVPYVTICGWITQASVKRRTSRRGWSNSPSLDRSSPQPKP